MPAYNEGDGLGTAIDEVVRDVQSVVPDCEIIVVDDGSTDGTPGLLAEKAANLPSLIVLRQANAGHGPALLNGISAARGSALLLIDSDRQIALDQFGQHWRQFRDSGLAAILGSREPRHDPMLRLVITRIMRVLIRARFGQSPRDAGVPYKLLRRDSWEELAGMIPDTAAIPSVLLAILLLLTRKEKVLECQVRHLPRRHGRSILRWRRLYQLCRDATAEILTLRRQIHRARANASYADSRSDDMGGRE
jgi:glycosyltransferase involved in cell wall biosynthesis